MSEIEITYVVELALPNTNAGNIHVIHIFYIMVYGRITPKLNIPKREKKQCTMEPQIPGRQNLDTSLSCRILQGTDFLR